MLWLGDWVGNWLGRGVAVACRNHWPLALHRHAGYDHSYYFVASFIEAHLRFHASHLGDPARE